MSHGILKKSLYLTSLFADIKSEHNWTTNETKFILLIFSELSKYKIYLPDFSYFEGTIGDYKNMLKDIPTDFIFTKEDFQRLTLVRKEHLSREINKVRKSLGSKIINTPHPIDSEDSQSGRTIPWFSEITYSSKKGEIFISLNPKAIERLVAFVKYSNISFENIVKIQNHNAIYTYLILKILKDASNQKHVILDIVEFKDRLGLIDKYRSFSTFKNQVLDVIEKEINAYTDFKLSYEVIKTGRSYKKIKFTFDYKPEVIEQQKNKTTKVKKKETHILDNGISGEYVDESSPFEQTLVGWGLRAKKVVEIEETYSLEVIQSAISLTLEKEKSGEIKTTKAAIFLGILENKQQASDEVFEREQQQLVKQNQKDNLKALGAEYDAIQKVINDNDDEVSSYLSAKVMGATYEISPALNEQLLNMSCVDAEKFKGFRPKLVVLHDGYFNMNTKKEVRPNMYDFLMLVAKYK